MASIMSASLFCGLQDPLFSATRLHTVDTFLLFFATTLSCLCSLCEEISWMLTVKMQDYDYYEAHAKDVKLEDITSDEDNADILARLRDNDPEFTGLDFTIELYDDSNFVVREGDHLGWLGYFVGRSEKLRTLSIFDFPDDINLNTFFRGLERNRSIEKLDILTDLGESFRSLIPFVRNNDSLRNLYFNGFDIGLQYAHNIAMLLSQQSSLKCLTFEETDLDEEGFKQIVAALRSLPQIEELSLRSNNLFRDPSSDELMESVSGLANGLEYLSSLFRAEDCSLCTLDLFSMHLGDDEAVFLANGLVGNQSLTNLKFNDSDITARGWAAFSRLLCDTSSVNSAYLSNHTLVQIGGDGTPSDIVEVLKWNEFESQKNAAVICKILDSHPDIDVTPLFEFNLMCLPLLIARLEKAKPYWCTVKESTDVFENRQLSAVFKFIRGMPQLAAKGFRSQETKDAQLQLKLKSKKRKLDQTL